MHHNSTMSRLDARSEVDCPFPGTNEPKRDQNIPEKQWAVQESIQSCQKVHYECKYQHTAAK